MNPAPPKSTLAVVTISHESASLQERERFSANPERLDAFYRALRGEAAIGEALLLSTCNRFELYAKVRSEGGLNGREPPLLDAIARLHGFDAAGLRSLASVADGEAAVRHLIEVAAGLRSQITGEAEILGQVKAAYAVCQRHGAAGAALNRVVQKAFQAAKRIRSQTGIGQGQISIASVAVDLSLKIFGSLEGARVLVLGSGDIGRKTAEALRGRGARRFAVASRSPERAARAAEACGGDALTLDEALARLGRFDIVIAATEAREPVVAPARLEAALAGRGDLPLFLLDLGMPRNVDPACGGADGAFLYNLDDLAAIAEENLEERRRVLDESRAIAAEKAAAIWQTLRRRGLVEG